MKKSLKWITGTLALCVLVLLIGGLIWFKYPPQASQKNPTQNASSAAEDVTSTTNQEPMDYDSAGMDEGVAAETGSTQDATTTLENSPLFNQPTQSNQHDLISPDGEWLLNTVTVGDEPLSRDKYYYLELINLKGKANKYLYMDWFERAEGGGEGLKPLGWAPSGQTIYLVSGSTMPDDHAPWSVVQDWIRGGGVYYLSLNNANSYPNAPLNPYNGYYPQDKYGSTLDADPKLGEAIWVEQPINTASGTTRLLAFPFADGPLKETTELFALATGTKAIVTSASIDTDGKAVAFVVHETGKQDQLWMKKLDAEKAVNIPYDDAYLQKIGITKPYVISVQKTSMSFDAGQGLFLTVRDSKGDKVIIRRVVFNDKTSWGQEW